jgi:hypothetical protein
MVEVKPNPLFGITATQDGTFLDALVDNGLMSLVARPLPFPVFEEIAFWRYYRLTPFGTEAAEYGKYKLPDKKCLVQGGDTQETVNES